MNKAEIRTRLRAMRRVLSKQEQDAAAKSVHDHLAAFDAYRTSRVVMAYMACRGELSLEPVIRDVLARGKTLVLPRCEADGIMTARRICAMSDLVPGAYGLLEPDGACEAIAPAKIDLILVPGVAFDRMGRRLGQGAGYYDRFLPGTQALCAGVCHDFALLENVPSQAHDIPMDFVITPGGIISPGKKATGGPEHG